MQLAPPHLVPWLNPLVRVEQVMAPLHLLNDQIDHLPPLAINLAPDNAAQDSIRSINHL